MKKFNKKILTVILVCAAVIAIIALAACGSKKEAEKPTDQTPVTDEAVQTTEKKKDDTVESIDLKTDEGELKFIECASFPDEAWTNTDGKKAVAVIFEYTNLSENESYAGSTFFVTCYQNGIELEDITSFKSVENDPVYEAAVHNSFTSVLTGGKLKVGYTAILSDDSPITVIARDNGFSGDQNKQKMVISFDQKENKSDETTKAATEAKKTIELKKDEKIKTDDFDFTLKNVELTYEVMPSDTSSVYSSYEAEDGKIYLDISGTYYNSSKKNVCIRDLPKFNAEYSDGYNYKGVVVVDTGNDFDWVSSYIICEPLNTCKYHCLIELPEAVENSEEPLKVTVNLGGTDYVYKVR